MTTLGNVDVEMVRGMVEDYWRSFLAVNNQSAGQEVISRFEERIAATASLMTEENAIAFLAIIEVERETLFNEYRSSPDALKRRLSIRGNRDAKGGTVAGAVAGATIWGAISSLFS